MAWTRDPRWKNSSCFMVDPCSRPWGIVKIAAHDFWAMHHGMASNLPNFQVLTALTATFLFLYMLPYMVLISKYWKCGPKITAKTDGRCLRFGSYFYYWLHITAFVALMLLFLSILADSKAVQYPKKQQCHRLYKGKEQVKVTRWPTLATSTHECLFRKKSGKNWLQ